MKIQVKIAVLLILFSCKQKEPVEALTAQQIVDRAIMVCGGEKYLGNDVSYVFRDKIYESKNSNGKKVLKRTTQTGTIAITDIKTNKDFQRFFNDSLISLPDTIADKYANAVNSVHYFSRLPYGLNDEAVKKKLLGEVFIRGKSYYKIKVTFGQENGGKDFEDIYLYWFDKNSFRPNYLAYEFHTDGGGMRFREAYNERYVNGIRFVDYNNYKPKKGQHIDFMKIDSLFATNQLEFLSKIELREIQVKPSG